MYSYGLDDRGLIPGGDKEFFSFRRRVHTGSGAYPALYPMDIGWPYAGGKAAEA
jgi:hypothetical protein